jgi:hypothetical protein
MFMHYVDFCSFVNMMPLCRMHCLISILGLWIVYWYWNTNLNKKKCMEALNNYSLVGCTCININTKKEVLELNDKLLYFVSLFSFTCKSRHKQSLPEVNVLVFICNVG